MTDTRPKTVVVKSSGNSSNRQKFPWYAWLILAALLIAAVPLSIYAHGKNNGTSVQTTKIVQQVRSVSGKSVDQDKKDATQAVLDILQTADKDPKNETVQQRLQALDNNDFSVIDKNLPNDVQFSSDSTEGMKVSTYQALITLSTFAKQSSSDKKIEASANGWQDAYADPTLGVVDVPASTFITKNSLFSLEMVYMDGTWKLAPYDLVNQLRIAAYIQEGTSAASSSASATPKK